VPPLSAKARTVAGGASPPGPPRRGFSTPPIDIRYARLGGDTLKEGLSGAGEGSRTPDLKLGKLALYRLSYARPEGGKIHRGRTSVKRSRLTGPETSPSDGSRWLDVLSRHNLGRPMGGIFPAPDRFAATKRTTPPPPKRQAPSSRKTLRIPIGRIIRAVQQASQTVRMVQENPPAMGPPRVSARLR
jgi:hypothetical protein